MWFSSRSFEVPLTERAEVPPGKKDLPVVLQLMCRDKGTVYVKERGEALDRSSMAAI
jgi:hypothetical protein